MNIVGQVDVIRVLCGRNFGGGHCVRGLRYRSPTAKSRRHPAFGVTSFGRPFRRWHYRVRLGDIITVVAMTCEACEAEPQARRIARGKRSATPGCHHPPPSCIRIGCELHKIPGTILRPYGMRQPSQHPTSGDINRSAVRDWRPTSQTHCAESTKASPRQTPYTLPRWN